MVKDKSRNFTFRTASVKCRCMACIVNQTEIMKMAGQSEEFEHCFQWHTFNRYFYYTGNDLEIIRVYAYVVQASLGTKFIIIKSDTGLKTCKVYTSLCVKWPLK